MLWLMLEFENNDSVSFVSRIKRKKRVLFFLEWIRKWIMLLEKTMNIHHVLEFFFMFLMVWSEKWRDRKYFCVCVIKSAANFWRVLTATVQLKAALNCCGLGLDWKKDWTKMPLQLRLGQRDTKWPMKQWHVDKDKWLLMTKEEMIKW